MLFGHERPLGAIGLFPNTVALVRDGSRTRDRQFSRLMLYPLSYSGRCYAEPAPFHRGFRGTQQANRMNREATAPPELTPTDRTDREHAFAVLVRGDASPPQS